MYNKTQLSCTGDSGGEAEWYTTAHFKIMCKYKEILYIRGSHKGGFTGQKKIIVIGGVINFLFVNFLFVTVFCSYYSSSPSSHKWNKYFRPKKSNEHSLRIKSILITSSLWKTQLYLLFFLIVLQTSNQKWTLIFNLRWVTNTFENLMKAIHLSLEKMHIPTYIWNFTNKCRRL